MYRKLTENFLRFEMSKSYALDMPKISGNGSQSVSFLEGGLIEFHGTRGDLFPLPDSVASSNDEKGRLRALLMHGSIDRQTFNSARIYRMLTIFGSYVMAMSSSFARSDSPDPGVVSAIFASSSDIYAR